MAKAPAGLINRGGIWHIEKRIGKGKRLRGSTGTSDRKEAEAFLVHRLEEIRQAEVYGVRPKRTWNDAAIKYVEESDKATLMEDVRHIRYLAPFIGHLPLEGIHMGTLAPFITQRRAQGRKTRTINYALQVVRHVLNLAAGEWMDDYGLTWLAHAPKIKLLPERDKARPYPLDWAEQERLFAELPPYLRSMALFKVNTGTRDQEVCNLRWDWEVRVPELNTSVFVIPAHRVKNREDRLVVLNSIAAAVIDARRGIHPEFVFTCRDKRHPIEHPICRMYNRAWKNARSRAGLPEVRVHDLKHTYGRRLRAAGIPFEDLQELLGHKSRSITLHYSQVDVARLLAASEAVCDQNAHKMTTLSILRNRKTNLRVVNS